MKLYFARVFLFSAVLFGLFCYSCWYVDCRFYLVKSIVETDHRCYVCPVSCFITLNISSINTRKIQQIVCHS